MDEPLADDKRVDICCGHVTCQRIVAAHVAAIEAERDRLREELGFMQKPGHERLYVRYRRERDVALAQRDAIAAAVEALRGEFSSRGNDFHLVETGKSVSYMIEAALAAARSDL